MSIIIPSTTSGSIRVPSKPIDHSLISGLTFDGTNYTISAGNLVRMLSFDDPSLIAGWSQDFVNGSLTLSSTVKRKGRYSGRFELNINDADVSGSRRCEISTVDGDITSEGWYGFSQYIPSSFVFDTAPEIVGQWHETPDFALGETYRSPPISLHIESDHYWVYILYDSKPVNTNLNHEGDEQWDLGIVTKDVWTDWVFHVKWSYQSDGILQVWKNGIKVLDYTGPNSYNDVSTPYFKIGIYKWLWKEAPELSQTTKRVVYFDEVRVGNSSSSFAEVSPK